MCRLAVARKAKVVFRRGVCVMQEFLEFAASPLVASLAGPAATRAWHDVTTTANKTIIDRLCGGDRVGSNGRESCWMVA